MPEVNNDIKDAILKSHKELLDTVEVYAKEIKNLDGRIEDTVKSKIDKLNSRLDDLEIKAFRPSTSNPAEKQLSKSYDPKRKEAYEEFLRKNSDELSNESRKLLIEHAKTLTAADATTGGFFIVPELETDIIKSIILLDPIRQYARVRTSSSNAVKIPKRIGTFAASWTGEVDQQTEAKGLKYAMEEVPNHTMTADVEVSIEDLEDSMFDLASFINSEISEQFALAEGLAFVSGSGKKQPEGFMTNASVAIDKTLSATGFSAAGDEFATIAHNLKSAYAKNATWFLNRQTIGKIRLIKDNQNRPLWLPFAESGLQGPNGPTIIGIPYAEIPHMDDVAANKYPVAIGDWRRAYVVIDRVSISVKRDEVTAYDRGVVRFLARKRVGGQLVLSEAVRKLKVSA